MGLYLNTDAGDQYPLASNAGWSALGAWVESLPDPDALAHLWHHGWAEPASAVRGGLAHAMEASPPGGRDTAHTARQLLATLGAVPADAALVVSDGMGPTDARESVLLENFTGTLTDSAGHERHYVDGKQVAGHGHDAGTGGTHTRPVPADAPPLAADLARVAQAHPDAAADPGTWAKVKDRAAKARDAVYGWMVRATPAAWELAQALADTPEDMRRFGFAPTMSGTDARRGDWLQAQTGVGTHLALSVASSLISSAVGYARKKLARHEAADDRAVAALAAELAALLAAVGGAFGVEAGPDAGALAAWVREHLPR